MEIEKDGIMVLDEGIVESAESLMSCCNGAQTMLKVPQ